MLSCGVLCINEPAERSSNPKLEAIQELATTHLREAEAAEGAAVVRVSETLQKFGYAHCYWRNPVLLRLGYPPVHVQGLRQGFSAHLLLSA